MTGTVSLLLKNDITEVFECTVPRQKPEYGHGSKQAPVTADTLGAPRARRVTWY